MKRIGIGIVNKSTNALPEYATKGSSGMDIRAFTIKPIVLQSLERCLVATGIFISIPEGFEAQMRPRSGIAIKQGLTCINSPGTIDSDYRGELQVPMVNLSAEPQTINNGDRIAQIVFQRVEQISWIACETLDTTARGEQGFGHTGIN